ncbi:MAG TPA: GtrA family protein [Acidimicrobiales bacterium]|nr:GtrA family protein [Acidimicrobiales bacterium]
MRTPIVLTKVLNAPRAKKLVKYASVSAISTATSLTVLAALTVGLAVPAVAANVVAVGLGTVPSFELNRRWVWARQGGKPTLAQVVPFCLLSLSGLLVSSLAVHFAAELTATGATAVRAAAVDGANLSAYGALWLLQFFLCERVLFRPPGTQLAFWRRRQSVQHHLATRNG